MVVARGHPVTTTDPLLTPEGAGEVLVEEFGYGLGPPTGILVLRYPPDRVVVEFPEQRDDFVHQIFWSPDGVLAVRRGTRVRHLSSAQALWLRRGVVGEVRALGVQTVLRICLRQATPRLGEVSAGTVTLDPVVAAALAGLAGPGVTVADALAVRTALLEDLDRTPPVELSHRAPVSRPALEVTRSLLADPADATGLAEWADRLHVSAKTLQRDFEREYEMSFSAWRTRARLGAAVSLLRHCTVTETAHRVGYSSASAFVAAFTREFGTTPGRFDAREVG